MDGRNTCGHDGMELLLPRSLNRHGRAKSPPSTQPHRLRSEAMDGRNTCGHDERVIPQALILRYGRAVRTALTFPLRGSLPLPLAGEGRGEGASLERR